MNGAKDPEDWRGWFCCGGTLKLLIKEPHRLGWLMGFEKLTPLHSEWIRYVWDSDAPRALQSFRGGYKTTSIVVVGCIRWMLMHPNDRILLIRKYLKAAAEVIKSISNAMQLEQIQELFKYVHGYYPRTEVNHFGNVKYNFKKTITPEGNLTAMGIDSSITGLHFDKAVCDDFVTIKDRLSRAERTAAIEMIREIAANIIDPGKGSVYTGTPWHRDDARAVVRSFCPIAKYPLSKYNFIGEAEAKRKRQTTTPYLYAANYELELGSDESLLFTDPVFSKGWNFSVTGTLAHLDAAFEGTDYCALTIAAPLRQEEGHTVYQIAGFAYAGNVKVWIPEIARLCRKYRARYIWVETNADHGYTADKLSAAGIRTKTYFEQQNKYVKITTCLFDVWRYLEWAPETDDEYMTQILDYKKGSAPDDAPDSAASLFREAFPQRKIDWNRWKL